MRHQLSAALLLPALAPATLAVPPPPTPWHSPPPPPSPAPPPPPPPHTPPLPAPLPPTPSTATTSRDSPGGNTSGWEFQTPGDNLGEVPHLDFAQAYLDVNVPVGNGLKLRAGRFYTIIGYESFDPRGNPFYSHSYIFNNEPLVNTGLLAFYQLNDQWSLTGGLSRGINQNTEDDNGAIDGLGQVTYTLSKQWQFTANFEVGPQNS